jgi:hypothetical protein
VRIT